MESGHSAPVLAQIDLTAGWNFNVEEFASGLIPIYPCHIYPLFQIIRDLCIKDEYCEANILDGQRWGFDRYVIQATLSDSEFCRVLLPVYLDEMLDIQRFENMVACCGSSEIYLTILSPESIIYQKAEISL
mmetsp:Transcript_15856/g.23882  ORF Transcript_15856/g.23882 Transcript_15856/m.23882 type:complete len:131 (-) Transcript_15856:342-734(-)